MPPSDTRSVTPWQLVAICGLLIASAAFVARQDFAPLLVGLCIASTALILPAVWWSSSGNRPAAEFGLRAAAPLAVAVVIGFTGQFGSVVGIACLATAVSVSAVPRHRQPTALYHKDSIPDAAVCETGTNDDVDSDLERRLLTRLAHGEVSAVADFVKEDADSEREVISRIERGVHEDGAEWIEGTLHAVFEPGQRLTTLHVPFWPALGASPEVDCEVFSSGDVRVRAACRQRWGLRFDLSRHTNADAAETVEIAFYARSVQSRREAA